MQTNIVIAGVGGQGVVTLGLIISQAAMLQGEKVVMSEIHGLAQRGGAVSVDVRIGNFHAPIIPTGEVDLTIGTEPVEARRAAARAAKGSRIVMSTEKLVPVSLSIHHKEYPDLEYVVSELSDNFQVRSIDALAIANSLGNSKAANTVLLGFILGIGWLPLEKEKVREQIEKTFRGKALEINLKALEMGFKEAESMAELSH